MDSPFRFPDVREKRGPDPRPGSFYRKYKSDLRKKFRKKCVYCRIPDALGTLDHEIDHYRPQKDFPHLVNVWKNLFYACRQCNQLKGNFCPTRRLFIPNPCDHRMVEHVQFEPVVGHPKTRHGKYMVERLRLNEPLRLQHREFVNRQIVWNCDLRQGILRDIAHLESLSQGSRSKKRRDTLRLDIEALQRDLQDIETDLEILTGECIKSGDEKPNL